MARVLIDASVTGEEWFRDALAEMAKCANVTFVYSPHSRYVGEISRNIKILSFLKQMKDIRRREDTDPNMCEYLIDTIQGNEGWVSEESCDDPHIFAIAYQKPGIFVFTQDKRIATCRSVMFSVLDNKFRKFSTIQSADNYKNNKNKIKS